MESIDGPSRYTLEQFLNTTNYIGGDFSFDEKRILFSSNETGIFNAYSLSIRGALKEKKPTLLTNSTDHSIYALTFFPNDDRILYSEDENGNEIHHIYLREANGTIRDLTPHPLARAQFLGWVHDCRSFLYASNARDPKFMDLYEMDIDTFEAKQLFQNESGFSYCAFSPNKRYLALSKTVSPTRSDLYLYDLETATLTGLANEKGARMSPQTFSLDSNYLYYLTDEDCDFTYVKKMDLNNAETSIEYKEAWDITGFSLSHKGTYQLLTVNEDAKQTVKIFLQDKTRLKLPKEIEKDIVRVIISRSEKIALFSVNSDISPTHFHLYNLEKKSTRRVNSALSPDIKKDDLVPSVAVRYRAQDKLAIPALYYQPKTASQDAKVPALIWVHGGPGVQSMKTYNYLIQYLVNQGYAVLAVNNRGSSGYGKNFYAMADKKHGEIDLQDCLDGKNFLISTGVIDPEKIGILGDSYGGYLTLAALAFYPDQMAVGVDLFGVSNWPRTLESLPAWWEHQREMLYQKIGNPTEERDYLTSISPLFQAHKIKKPLLVLQGANDPRVLQAESDEIIAALEKSGIPYRYLVFDDEGHGFKKDRNRLLAGKAILEFLDKYLKN